MSTNVTTTACQQVNQEYQRCLSQEPEQNHPVHFMDPVPGTGLRRIFRSYAGKMSSDCLPLYQLYAACKVKQTSEGQDKTTCKLAWKRFSECQKNSSRHFVCVKEALTATGGSACSGWGAVYFKPSVPCRMALNMFYRCQEQAALAQSRDVYASCVLALKGDPKNLCTKDKANSN